MNPYQPEDGDIRRLLAYGFAYVAFLTLIFWASVSAVRGSA